MLFTEYPIITRHHASPLYIYCLLILTRSLEALLTGWEGTAQKDQMSCSRSHGWWTVEVGLCA